MNSKKQIQLAFFFIILLFLFVVNINLFTRFAGILTLSYVAVVLMYPIFKFLKSKLKSVLLSSFITYLLFLIFIIVPLVLISLLVVKEAVNITNNIEFNNFINNFSQLQSSLNSFILSINNFLKDISIEFQFTYINIYDFIIKLDSSTIIQDQLIPLLRNLATFSGELLFGFFIFTISTLFILPIWEKLPNYFSKISPLDDRHDKLILNKIYLTVKNIIFASVGVAILQATAVIIPIFFMNVGAPFLLWILMVILSIIPIGSGVVWFPLGLAYIVNGIVSGNIGLVFLGIFVIFYSAIIINVVDAYFRPKFMSHSLGLHPLIIILSVIGGIGMLGPLGIIYGPVAVVLLITFLEIYRSDLSYEGEE